MYSICMFKLPAESIVSTVFSSELENLTFAPSTMYLNLYLKTASLVLEAAAVILNRVSKAVPITGSTW